MSIFEVQHEGTIFFVRAESEEALADLVPEPMNECHVRRMGSNESVRIMPQGDTFSVAEASQEETSAILNQVRLF